MDKKWTIPNLLTIFRLFLVPVFVLVYIYVNPIFALIIFILAGFTDVLDGYIARKFNLITDLGKILDPLADKTLRIAAVTVLAFDSVLPMWTLAVIAILDFYLIITSAVLYKRKFVVSSNVWGKVAGSVSMLAIVLSFFSGVNPLNLIVLYVAFCLILISIIVYTIRVKDLHDKLNKVYTFWLEI